MTTTKEIRRAIQKEARVWADAAAGTRARADADSRLSVLCAELACLEAARLEGEARPQPWAVWLQYTQISPAPPPRRTTIKDRSSDGAECVVCSLSFCLTKSDRADHRRWCAPYRRMMWPQPSLGLRKRARANLVEVTGDSPKWLQDRFYKCKVMFQREFGLDAAAYPHSSDRSIIGYFFVDDDGRTMAVVSMRIPAREPTYYGGEHRLAWVWVPPSQRRAGVLSNLWPRLEEAFPAFGVEDPISDAMRIFLEQRDELSRVVGWHGDRKETGERLEARHQRFAQ
jgi:hypothetical protein